MKKTKDKNYEAALATLGEIGYVRKVSLSLVWVEGLPNVTANECVIFENGEIGQVISLSPEYVEVILFTTKSIRPGDGVARTGQKTQMPLGDGMLGTILNPLGQVILGKEFKPTVFADVNLPPSGIENRKSVELPLETGHAIVDLLVPLGKGQRELVIGDRKTGKSSFLLQTVINQVRKGTICVYCAIGKPKRDISSVYQAIKKSGSDAQTVIVATGSSDPGGLIFLTPYSAMSIAEYFRDKGNDVLIVFDDLTTHAGVWREIMLLARRFPGRSSYPGDIFYIHSRLLERAGNFKKGSISALPVAESVLGDLAGYIQTNLMAITDGHIFFDSAIFNEGRRPAINTFLSVTRVGEQAQSELLRDLGRQLSRFLSQYQRIRELVHFGAEFEERVKKDLTMGEQMFEFFNQPPGHIVPVEVSIFIIGILWNGLWLNEKKASVMAKIKIILETYSKDASFRQKLNTAIAGSKSFANLVSTIREDAELLKIV